jgi:hypothetical protein
MFDETARGTEIWASRGRNAVTSAHRLFAARGFNWRYRDINIATTAHVFHCDSITRALPGDDAAALRKNAYRAIGGGRRNIISAANQAAVA